MDITSLFIYGLLIHGAIDCFQDVFFIEIFQIQIHQMFHYKVFEMLSINYETYRMRSMYDVESYRKADGVIHHRGPNSFLCSSSRHIL